MSAVKKLFRAEAVLETGTITRTAESHRVPSGGGRISGTGTGEGTGGERISDTRSPESGRQPLFEVEVRLSTGTFGATLSKSCLVTPELGDKVLCAVDSEAVYVISVLAGRPGAPTTLSTKTDLRLSSKGRVSVHGAEGVDIAGASSVAIASPEIHLRAQRGTFAIEDLGFLGRLVQAEVSKVALVAREVDSVVTRLSQRAKRVFRFIEEIDQTRAGTVDLRAQHMLGLRAENALIAARVLAKVDGEQIHLG